jgi:DNA polymerase III subunit epsilon
MSLNDLKFCAIDIETTGLDIKADEIIAFACVPLLDSRIIARDAFYTLIRPENYRLGAMKYHGISEKDLEHAPTFKDVALRILETMDGVLLGHSVEFDYEFLRRYFKKYGIDFKRDTLDIILIERWLGRKCGKMGEDLSFEAIMRRYRLKESHRHNALADAYFAAQVFQMELSKLSEMGIDSEHKLKKIVKSCRYALW